MIRRSQDAVKRPRLVGNNLRVSVSYPRNPALNQMVAYRPNSCYKSNCFAERLDVGRKRSDGFWSVYPKSG